LREVIRKNKQLIEPTLEAKSLQLGMMIFYRSNELPTYSQLEQTWQKLVHKLTADLENPSVNNE
jgi:hypothetical protein